MSAIQKIKLWNRHVQIVSSGDDIHTKIVVPGMERKSRFIALFPGLPEILKALEDAGLRYGLYSVGKFELPYFSIADDVRLFCALEIIIFKVNSMNLTHKEIMGCVWIEVRDFLHPKFKKIISLWEIVHIKNKFI